jgi:hypothetical protein
MLSPHSPRAAPPKPIPTRIASRTAQPHCLAASAHGQRPGPLQIVKARSKERTALYKPRLNVNTRALN